ncbi:MAG: hypothetical protein KAT68_03200 [Bacteroidales bacterium]|nr:hypothetical protein [Bacteroidales bacterium]
MKIFKATFLKAFIIFLLIIFYSCIKNIDNDPDFPKTWSPAFAVPIGSTTIKATIEDFGIDTSILKIASDSVPIYFDGFHYNISLEKIELVGALHFPFESLAAEFETLKSIEFSLNINNGFPTTTSAQIYFYINYSHDVYSIPIDSLFADESWKIFEHGNLNDEGIVTSSDTENYRLTFSENRIQNLKQVEWIVIKLNLPTTRDPLDILQDTVKFKSNYSLYTQLGLRVGLEIEI